MPGWVIWSIVGGGARASGSSSTPGLFFLGPVASPRARGHRLACVGRALWLQLIVFVGGVDRVARLLLRPIARAHLTHARARCAPARPRSSGAGAVVLQRVDAHGGRVKIGGEEWSARAYIDDQVIEPGTQVEVVKIEGATALVYE